MPTDNVFIEVFNGQFRQECLNEDWFLSLEGPGKWWSPGVYTTMKKGPTAHGRT